METIKELLEYTMNSPLSIDLLNGCKRYFHYQSSTKEEKNLFIQVLQEKVGEVFPNTKENVTIALANYIVWGGIPDIDDIIFVDDAIFVEPTDNFGLVIKKHAEFIGNQNGQFKKSLGEEFVDAFTKLCTDKQQGAKFSKEFNKIYNNIYGCETEIIVLPENLNQEDGYHSFYYTTFAINSGEIEKDIALAYQNGTKTTFRIADQSRHNKRYRLLTIEVDPTKEASLKVLNISNSVTRLSDMLQEYEQKQSPNYVKINSNN